MLSKRHLRLFWICMLIALVTIWLSREFQMIHNSSYPLPSFPMKNFHQILDDCMMEESPCVPEIEPALKRYFADIQTRFSMLLTYHPRIDCNHGRYLLMNDALNSHVYHGTGSQLMWYLGVLNIAHVLNLTVVHLEWTSEHTEDEKNSEREAFWKFFDWEIPHSAYMSCPSNSSVKKNVFRYNLTADKTFDQVHQGKQPFQLKSDLKSKFNDFLTSLDHDDRDSPGFTFYSDRTITISSSLMEIGVVFETRWWLQHRKLYNELNGVWSGNPFRSNYHPIDHFQYIQHYLSEKNENENRGVDIVPCSPIDPRKTLLIGVHIRQGDVVRRNSRGRIISGDLYRYISSSAYPPLLTMIINGLDDYLSENYLITIYSEGSPTDFDDVLVALTNTIPNSRCRISLFLNGRTSETFNRMLRDDVILGAHSTFSMSAGIFNSRQLKIGPTHNRARVHGMRNHFGLTLDVNHTIFLINEQQIQQIKERIDYVWQMKHLQLQTASPLWLENYSDDYPEEFMLI